MRGSRACWSWRGQSKASLTYCEALQQAPRAGGVGDAPLHHLAAAQSIPEAVALPFLWPVGHAVLSLMARV